MWNKILLIVLLLGVGTAESIKVTCQSSSDPVWLALELSLNEVYKLFGKGDSYDWCGGVCVGPIIGVVVGVLAGVGIIVGVIIYMRRRKAARQQNGLMAISTYNETVFVSIV